MNPIEREPRPVQRRRGAELHNAIMDAAWDTLTEQGYRGFTFDAVAERAATSRPVLYRRWSSREELLRATIAHRGITHAPEPPDTGSLREDVLAALRQSNAQRSDFIAMLSASLGEFYSESGSTPSDLREIMVGGRTTMDVIVDRAIERGEVDPARATPLVRSVPFTMYRHEVLMTLAPVSEAWLTHVVDEVFLPLVTFRS